MNLLFAVCTLTIPVFVLSSQRPVNRILSGVEVSIEGHEFMAALMDLRLTGHSRRHEGGMVFVCSAVIITSKCIFTTATCAQKVGKDTAVVRSNTTDWHHKKGPYRDHTIADIYLNPNWNFKEYDAAILTVTTDFNDLYEKAIELEWSASPTPSDYLETYGWGRVDLFGTADLYKTSFQLMGTGTKIIDPSECAYRLPDYLSAQVKDRQFLLCTEENEIGGCDGDEGGPLIWNGKLAGILSYPGCGKDLSIYVSIFHIGRWISKYTKPGTRRKGSHQLHNDRRHIRRQTRNQVRRHNRNHVRRHTRNHVRRHTRNHVRRHTRNHVRRDHSAIPQVRMMSSVRLNILGHGFVAAVIEKAKGVGRLSYKLHCTSTIISETYALTAASCVRDLDKSKIILRGNTTRWEDGEQSVDHKVKKIHIHPGAIPNCTDNNLALILVHSDTQFTGIREEIAKFIKRDVLNKNIGFPDTYGWGWIDTYAGEKTYKPSLILRGIGVHGILDNDCNEKLPKNIHFNPKTEVCVGEFAIGPCFGDEGAPLIYLDVLFGIASFVGCGKTASVYLKIYAYGPWIYEITKDRRHNIHHSGTHVNADYSDTAENHSDHQDDYHDDDDDGHESDDDDEHYNGHGHGDDDDDDDDDNHEHDEDDSDEVIISGNDDEDDIDNDHDQDDDDDDDNDDDIHGNKNSDEDDEKDYHQDDDDDYDDE